MFGLFIIDNFYAAGMKFILIFNKFNSKVISFFEAGVFFNKEFTTSFKRRTFCTADFLIARYGVINHGFVVVIVIFWCPGLWNTLNFKRMV